jgi:adiponectin receptor
MSTGQISKKLHINNIPGWMQADPYIQLGYRAQTDSFLACLFSLFYPHNEFVNSWSHLIRAIFYATLLLSRASSVLFVDVDVSSTDARIVQMYIAGTSACLFFSVCGSFYIWYPEADSK